MCMLWRTVASAHGRYGERGARATAGGGVGGIARIAERAVARDWRQWPAQVVHVHLINPEAQAACLWRSICVRRQMQYADCYG